MLISPRQKYSLKQFNACHYRYCEPCNHTGYIREKAHQSIHIMRIFRREICAYFFKSLPPFILWSQDTVNFEFREIDFAVVYKEITLLTICAICKSKRAKLQFHNLKIRGGAMEKGRFLQIKVFFKKKKETYTLILVARMKC